MTFRNSFLSFAAAVLIALFLIPTLITTQTINIIPFSVYLLFFLLPLVVVPGMIIANYIGKKLGILWQLAKFALVGVLNTVIDFGVLNFLIAITTTTSGIGIIFINAISFLTAVINSYFWNKEWVFTAGKKGNFATFFIVTLIGLSINTGIVYTLTTYIPPVIVSSETLWANLAKVLATGISLVWNFMGYKLIVFKK